MMTFWLTITYSIAVGVGALNAVFVFLFYDRYLHKSIAQGKRWAQSEEHRRLPLVCAGGPLFAISQFWLVSIEIPSTLRLEF